MIFLIYFVIKTYDVQKRVKFILACTLVSVLGVGGVVAELEREFVG